MPLKSILLLVISVLVYATTASAQCGAGISVFPYQESFESNDGGWVTGGTNSDWTWGIPAKTNINSAGTGIRCWMTGGLTGNSYNGGQNSWLRSPCFNLSNLPNPVIYFKIFWDTERNFDGAGFQYSLNNGTTWQNLGAAGSSTNCLNANWYNDGGIVYLSAPGWSGNVQPSSGNCVGGFGSWGWLVAQHDLSTLAGQPNVMFRFTFGSGTACNAYNGVAVDDIVIRQAAPGLANFTFSCSGNRTVSFYDSSSLCSTSLSWNFGDPASGANNTSTLKDPVHVFSAPGSYTVTQTASFAVGPPAIQTKTIRILDASISSSPVRCFGENNGSATASVSGGTGPVTYSWNTVPVQTTPTVNNLKPGNYIVSISSANACSIKDSVAITEPQPLGVSIANTPEICNNNKGSLSANVTGGTTPYSFQWSSGATTAIADSLSEGDYTLLVSDARGCTVDSSNIVVTNRVNPNKASLGNDTTICPGEKLILSPGDFSAYQWQDASTASTFEVIASGTYSVNVTDSDGCSSSDAIHVEVICIDLFFPTGFTPNNDGNNDGFGPGGRLDLVKNYSFKVYSRYGDLVYSSTDPYHQWNGKIKGTAAATGTYIWHAAYQVAGRNRTQKGTIVLLK